MLVRDRRPIVAVNDSVVGMMLVLVIVVVVTVFVRVCDAVEVLVRVGVFVIVVVLVFTHMRFASRARREFSRYDSERRIPPLRYVRQTESHL